MLKAKKYDWKDSNLALFGSDTEKAVKKESAEAEPAWHAVDPDAGNKLYIWRINNFQVEAWPEDQYGKFFEGDSYIVLNQYLDEESVEYDVHFWIGRYSSQDEYGTAAYKTVELDTYLDDKPVQHREVMGHESALFCGYFKQMETMRGGVDSGFNKVTPEEYKPRLFKFNGSKGNIRIKEVPRLRESLNSDDVFILDLGLTFIQWNGSGSTGMERYKAAQFLETLKAERNGQAEATTVDEGDEEEAQLTEKLGDDEAEGEDVVDGSTEKVLMQLSDRTENLEFTERKTGDVTMEDFDSEDVFLLDSGDSETGVFVWIGNGASIDERKNSMSYAHKYLQAKEYPWAPIAIVSENKAPKNKAFMAAIAA
ncbi:unnamed protein product [Owenia fusiformis]|uniref:Gelsolin-like domain-containing protein n=1 Tax=Owenia fusiformis TaxID=6347 RepID=A0A8S4NJ66_OWEFU|nr:unnamed protein product [Owenia fusiformis]